MKEYLISLFAAAFLSAVVGILSPDGGIGKHTRLASMFLTLCLIAAPIPRVIESIRSFSVSEPSEQPQDAPFSERSDGSLTAASRAYLARTLSERIAGAFSLPGDTVTCTIRWGEDGNPESVTVLLSGKAIWTDTRALESYVTDLLHCPCTTAIA